MRAKDVTWRLLLGGGHPAPAHGAINMAVDRALLDSVAAGASPTLRLYRWTRPTLSFGRNQPARGLYDEAGAAALGIDFVRRPTGGQAVLHDDELTYAVVAPVASVGKPRRAYEVVNHALVSGLRSLGLEATLAEARGPVRAGANGAHDWAAACFRTPARGEVVAGGRKLVGSAQRTAGRTILQHGSILVSGSQAAVEELLVDGVGSDGAVAARSGWTTVAAELGRRPGWPELASAIAHGFGEVLGISLAPDELAAHEIEDVRRLAGRFASATWTWRR